MNKQNTPACDTNASKQQTSIGKLLRFFIIGIFFGIVMTKSEAISWYRIYEMFRFESFHMYGIIGVAVTLGIVAVAVIKKFKLNNIHQEPIPFKDKEKSYKRYAIGGFVFGLGWAMSGACPGPMFTLIGNGYLVFLVVVASAMLGTFVYGLLRNKLPH